MIASNSRVVLINNLNENDDFRWVGWDRQTQRSTRGLYFFHVDEYLANREHGFWDTNWKPEAAFVCAKGIVPSQFFGVVK